MHKIYQFIRFYIDTFHAKYSISVLLKNKQNISRDHLANERNFLAWTRTSLLFITTAISNLTLIYIAIMQLYPSFLGKLFGLLSIMQSMTCLYLGIVRYYHVQWALQHLYFPASQGAIVIPFICTLSLFIGLFITA
ncbi:hypothetical protein BCV72DRAFT_205580 [Rhizopus microsporus var. microsporus]|uniref:DUF202 domain-containing protein n=1 Tax=Rhizopus microsporus var. microsporus TaxID=86635 RepID=A0A1X0R5Z3_RHIZD|nr:hypothetical protein BCV72DRAFT_205580 [Rhizopus microsporus var. microsporus]